MLSTAGLRVSGLCGFAAEPKRRAATSLQRTSLGAPQSLGGSVRRLLSPSTTYLLWLYLLWPYLPWLYLLWLDLL